MTPRRVDDQRFLLRQSPSYLPETDSTSYLAGAGAENARQDAPSSGLALMTHGS